MALLYSVWVVGIEHHELTLLSTPFHVGVYIAGMLIKYPPLVNIILNVLIVYYVVSLEILEAVHL